MDISQLRSLVTIARCGTVARAAEALHLSQPAISAHIKLLEEELGLRLFDRHAKGMALTSAGEAVFNHAKDILRSFEAIRDQARSVNGELSGELVIGTVNDPAFLRLPAFLKLMREMAPNVSISLVQSTSGGVMKNIADGVFDAGFFEGSVNGRDLSGILLTKAEYVVGFPTAWRDQVGDNLSAALSLPWIGTSDDCSFYQLTNTLFESHGRNFSPAIRTDQESLLLDLVRQEGGLSLLRRDMLGSAAAAGVSALDGVVVEAGVHFVVSQNSAKPALLKLARDAVQRAWQL
jgi:DNA-binding transcriptional LysR family regulator